MSTVVRLKAPKPLVTLIDSAYTITLLREEILRSKNTYQFIAHTAQLASSTVSNIAIGHTKWPRLETIIRLLSALGWTIQAVRNQ
jgi:DNA-binding phage protein